MFSSHASDVPDVLMGVSGAIILYYNIIVFHICIFSWHDK